LTLLLAGTGGLVGGIAYLQHWAERPLSQQMSPPTQVVEFTPGATLFQFSRDLVAQGLLDCVRCMGWYARASGTDRQLQAGEYRVTAGMTPRALLEKLRRGEVETYDFRIAEGSTVAQVLAELAQVEALTHTLKARTPGDLSEELGWNEPFAEGMFLPDTYQFRRGDSDLDVLLRAHRAMRSRLQMMWATRNDTAQLREPHDLLILASIIEKETGAAEDRRLVSQVFHNRLREGMRLQSDPTVIYGLGDGFDGDLTRVQLQTDGAFNSYRRRGLPPTPISLPSVAALMAAANPLPGDYFYFVAKGDGSTKFSRTLAEHNLAVRKYQLGK